MPPTCRTACTTSSATRCTTTNPHPRGTQPGTAETVAPRAACAAAGFTDVVINGADDYFVLKSDTLVSRPSRHRGSPDTGDRPRRDEQGGAGGTGHHWLAAESIEARIDTRTNSQAEQNKESY